MSTRLPLAGADAVPDKLRSDLPKKLGACYPALQAVNPRIGCAQLSACGRAGSRTAWPGYNHLMQAEAGHMTMTGAPDGPPTCYGLSIVDILTGLVAAFGLLADELGHPEWRDDVQLCSIEARLKNRDRVTRELDGAMPTDTTAHWLGRLSGKIPVSPLFDEAQAPDNAFVHERNGVIDCSYDDGRQARMVANPIRVPGVALPARAAPRMGEHNDALLAEAGFSAARISKLRELGVIAPV
jgi:crotonobetainyl-CoA:carnitine CoA-transferase CaiB-like acyl-CoA transferase